MTPKERQARSDEERSYCLRVASEEDRIRRFLHMDGLEKMETMATASGKVETLEVEENVRVPTDETRSRVLSRPVLGENPASWMIPSAAAAAHTPGRELMERYIASTLKETSTFLKRETA
jgi:hypothetical protein